MNCGAFARVRAAITCLAVPIKVAVVSFLYIVVMLTHSDIDTPSRLCYILSAARYRADRTFWAPFHYDSPTRPSSYISGFLGQCVFYWCHAGMSKAFEQIVHRLKVKFELLFRSLLSNKSRNCVNLPSRSQCTSRHDRRKTKMLRKQYIWVLLII